MKFHNLARLAWGGVLLAAGSQVLAQSGQTAQGDVSVTIYNNDRALVQDVRQLDIPRGRTRIEFPDVSARIEPQTLSFAAAGTGIVEQNFDFDLLTPSKMMEKAIGQTVTLLRTNPATGAETRERATVLSTAGGVADARAAIPELVVTTDLIVGFPGETEDDFSESMAFVEEMRFAHAHIFPFSARQGTAAVRFGQQVRKVEKKERSRRMHALLERIGSAERARFVGAVRPVLWEGVGQPLTDQPGRLWSGLTDNYLRVMAIAPAHLDLHNQIISTRLEELNGDTLFGTLC